VVTRTLLDEIVTPGGLTVRFQPVVEIRARDQVVRYEEGLVRGPAGTNVETADVLFSYVRRKHAMAQVDRLCVSAVLAAASRDLPAGENVGINVDASTLTADPTFPDFLAQRAAEAGIAQARLVIEVVEHTVPYDFGAFRCAVGRLRDQGVRIALDDVGRAHSNFRMMLETRPDFFKVDRYFVSGAHADPLRQEVLRSIAGLACAFGADVVAEGIETSQDFRVVRSAGIRLVQGFGVVREGMQRWSLRPEAGLPEPEEGKSC
jgi:EAL domain-containing protein (putative c-di-GMP-specific phosphodiesterase class I)